MSARHEHAARYELGAPLGRGSSGTVYTAIDRKRGGTVAVKMLDRIEPKTLFALKNEFRSLADTVHPNLATLHELVCENDLWYLAMELVDGGDFLSYVRPASARGDDAATVEDVRAPPERDASTDPDDVSAGRASGTRPAARLAERAARAPSVARFDERRLRLAMRELAEGVSALHAAGKVHRDLKPSNVLIRRDGSVAVVDFGLVQSTARVLSASPSSTSVAGTPLYVAPEVLMGSLNTPASDWYAVGVMLYEALTGEAPFTGGPQVVLFAKVQRDPVPIDHLVLGAPADLVALCHALLSREPDTRPTGARILELLGGGAGPSSGGSAQETSTELFVGRLPELLAMRTAWDEVTSAGTARTLIIRGPSGIGKSRLVETFVSDVRADGRSVVLDGRCYERETVPFKAMDTVVDALSTYLLTEPYRTVEPWVPANVTALLRAFPVLERVRAVADARTELPRNVDPARLRAQAFDALRTMLGAVAEHRPLVIRLDDVQWGDSDSAAMLAHVLAGPDAPPLLLIACHRDGDEREGALVRALRGAGRGRDSSPPGTEAVREIVLSTMEPDATASLVRHYVPGASQSFVDLVSREAEDIPFFVCALARHLGRTEGAREAFEAGTLGIRDVLGRTHASLDASSVRMLATVCVASEPLDESIVERAADVPRERATAIWKQLRALHLVRALGGEEHDEVEPYHGRVRDFVTSRIAESERPEVHRSIAIVLETNPATEPALLADHWLAAGDSSRALEYTRLAADRAAGALAFERAATLFRRAIVLSADDAHEDIRRLTVAMGDAFANAGRGASAAPLLLMAALDAATEERLELERRAAEQWLFSGHLQEGLDVLEQVLRTAGLPRPHGAVSMVSELVWKRTKLAFRSLTKEPTRAPTSAECLRIDACRTGAWALSTVDLLEGAVFQARQVELALDAGDPHRIVLALAWHAAILGSSGPGSRASADRFVEAARRLLAGRDDPHGAAFVDLSAGTCAVMSGDYRVGLELLQRAERRLTAECRGVAWEIGIARLFSASCLTYLGRFTELRASSTAWLDDARRRGDRYASTNMVLHESTTLLAIASGDVDAGRAAFQEASEAWEIAPGTSQDFYRHLLPSYFDLYSGDPKSARDRLRAYYPAFKRSPFGQVRAQDCQIRFVRALAELAAGTRNEARADERFLARSGLPFGRVTSAMLRAGIAAQEGRRDDQRRELRAAIAEAEAHGLGIFATCSELSLASLEGAEAVRLGAEGRLLDAGIVEPIRFARLFVPIGQRD